MKKRLVGALVAVAATAALLTGCTSQADQASQNLSNQADSFQVYRDITFINGITDKYLLEKQGYCSVNQTSHQVAIICKVGPDSYTKDFMALSNNVTYVTQQVKPFRTSAFYHVTIIKPQELLPNVQVQTGK